MLINNSVERWPPIVYVDGWLKTNITFLVILGFSGCGKTVASGFMLAEFGGIYVHARSLARIFAGSFGESFEMQERIKTARYVVIDDLNTEENHNRFKGALYEVIDARQSRRTILTSNLNRKAFDEVYKDARIQRRLERAKFVVVKK
jgi:DNA replication protein DnaC